MKYLIQSFTIVVFLNLIYYFTFLKVINFPSYFVYILLFMFLISYYLFFKKKFVISKLFLLWMILYLILNTIYFIVSGAASDTLTFYKIAIGNLFIFLSFSLLYDLDNNDMIITRKAISIALIVGAFLLVYDFTHPDFFPRPDDVPPGRAVATYGNANAAGALLIVGFILTIDIIPKKVKLLYAILLFSGILATFSRSNIIVYTLIVIIMSMQKKISKISVFILVFSFIILIFWLYYIGAEYLSQEYNLHINTAMYDRLAFFVNPNAMVSNHYDEREGVLKAAISMFMDNPLFGNGIGSTKLWKYAVGPHNQFAANWADFGLFGLLIIPTFLFVVTYNVIFNGIKKEYRDIGILFIIYFVFSSFFSHNMFDFTFNYAASVIIAILGYKNKIRRKYYIENQ